MDKYHLTRTAVFVILENDGKIFYLRRKNTGWNDGKLTLPSGHVDQGETIRHAAVREVQEEAGVHIEEDDLDFIHVHYVYDKYTNFYFKASKWKGEPTLNEPDLASEIKWIEKDVVPEDVVFCVRHMLEEVLQNSYFSDSPNDLGV